jgi:pimeloyl-ACP methyl ester carboxylesterase
VTERVLKNKKPPRKKISNQDVKAPDKQPTADDTSTPHTITTYTITHADIKKPIQCHQYTLTAVSSINPAKLIFTHGAGGTLSADAVVNFSTGFSTSLPVLAFQGSMNLKARTKAFHACIDELRAKDGHPTASLLLGGRSMGARAAVIAASEHLEKPSNGGKEMDVRLILVSYPLQGPKDVRDQILLDLPKTASVLFIIGDKDAMCPLDLLNNTRIKMRASTQLVVVRGADHGMHVKPARLERDTGEETGRKAAAWVEGKIEEDIVYIGELEG